MGTLAAIAALLLAQDLTPERVAQIQRDLDKKMEQVNKKYGNRKSSELSPDERREMIHDQRDAEASTLDKHGVEAKDYARYEARMNLAERQAVKDEKARLDKKEAEEKKAAETKPQREVQIQRGFSDSNPVMLEEKTPTSAQPTVEKGLPPDAIDDQNAASGGKHAADNTPPPPKKKGKK